MRCILSYVNTTSVTDYVDKEFGDIFELWEHINKNYPDFTSYQVIFLKTEVNGNEK